jgi:type IV secretion system protein VirB10
MRAFVALLTVTLGAGVVLPASSQTSQEQPHLTPRNGVLTAPPVAPPPAQLIQLASGTKIPLTLKQGITTKSARPGDPVYAQTAFPITANNQIAIPAGTYVQGEVRQVVRPGRVKGRAELQMSFTSMIFPNGYTVMLPGAVQNTPGSTSNSMKGTEGTIQGDSSKGKDVGTVVGATIPGAGIGAIADGSKGAAIGAASGGILGLATVLLTRGPEVTLGTGDSVEMVLESNIELDPAQVHKAAAQ